MYDLTITGGTVVDGTGADRYRADIGVKDGRIVEMRRRDGDGPGIEGDAAQNVDATGRVVTPGFVDVHTHYDGQVSWDATLEPSSLHGVTTVVSGNCGVGFAPVRPGREQWLIELMEGVEDIPGSALAEGITWQWESFPEYLDAIEKRDLAVDYGTQVAHGAVRGYAMGERGARNEEATDDDIAAMARIVQEAVEAGALGFSTSRTEAHRAIDGEAVPGTYAAEAELFGLGRAMAAGGRAVFEVAPQGTAGESPAEASHARTRLDDEAVRRDRPAGVVHHDSGARAPRTCGASSSSGPARPRRTGSSCTRRSRPGRSACCSDSRVITRSPTGPHSES